MNRPVETKIINTDGREARGYDLIEELELNCENCSVILVNIIKVSESAKINKFMAVCPICGDKTFISTVKGEAYAAAAEGFSLSNVVSDITDTDEKGLVISNILELIKNA